MKAVCTIINKPGIGVTKLGLVSYSTAVTRCFAYSADTSQEKLTLRDFDNLPISILRIYCTKQTRKDRVDESFSIRSTFRKLFVILNIKQKTKLLLVRKNKFENRIKVLLWSIILNSCV